MDKQSEQEDLCWIQKARNGDHQAFAQLVKKYQKLIYYCVRKFLVTHDDTHDIVQETFIKMYKNLETFDEKLPFLPWLYRIAINNAINFKKRSTRYQQAFTQRDDSKGVLPANDQNPLKEVMHQELQEKITCALEQLPDDQRIVFVLRTSEEFSYKEISEYLQISVGTVMSRLSRARAKLKEKLSPYLCSHMKGRKTYEL